MSFAEPEEDKGQEKGPQTPTNTFSFYMKKDSEIRKNNNKSIYLIRNKRRMKLQEEKKY